MPFLSLGLHPSLAQAANALGFTEPTPVQMQAIPAVLTGSDVLASAQTGSGKTAAFALPLLQRLQELPAENRHQYGRAIRALIVVPTRELATQVGDVVRSLTQALPQHPKVVVVTGGVSINPQMMALRGGADVLVATPGRLLDLAAQNAVQLATVRLLVLDEADRLLDLGFAEELGKVLTLLPPRRQSLFFSATFPPDVRALAGQMLNDPVQITVASTELPPADIVQRAIAVDTDKRTQLLRHLIKDQGWKRVLVFVATKYTAELVAEKLYKARIYATAFHGDLSQGARKQVLAEFKDEQWEVVITTDLASRGIDIAKLPVVVNYDLPRSAVDYVHRIGRTGRAGEPGLAVSFVSADTEAHFHLIEKRQGLSLALEEITGFEPTEVATPIVPQVAADKGGIKGKRPSKKDKLRAQAAQQPKPD
ncbi:MAG: DEAD/DEAH box helicase [Rhodoferax sp.]|jgi:ATP-dependent RNA helicase RhlE